MLLLQRFAELGGVLLGVQHLDGLADAEAVLQKHAEGVRAKGVLGGEHAVAVLHAVGQHEPVLLVESNLRLGHAGHGRELLHPVHGLPPKDAGGWISMIVRFLGRARLARENPRAWKTPAD